MIPNKVLTSGSPLRIPLPAAQPPPSSSAAGASNGSPIAPQDCAQEPAEFSADNLSHEQVAVLRAIASGKGITAAAQEAGINRSTIYRWQRDPNFQHWLSAWRWQTKESGRNILVTLIERSARVVERALDKDDIRVAVTVLTKFGVLGDKDLSTDIPAIAGEGTTNEKVKKIDCVSPSR